MSTKEPVSHSFYELHEEGQFDGNFEIALLQCDEDPPPTRKENSVKRFAKLKCKTDMPYADLQEHLKAKGGNFKKLVFAVRMVPSGAVVGFTVFVDGKQVGSSNVNIHYS